MEVKGTAIKTTKEFVKTKFPDRYQDWVDSLPANSRAVYTDIMDASKWYEMNEAFLLPIEHIVKMFYPKEMIVGAEAIGKYSAEVALSGIYKAFLLIASPVFLMKTTARILQTYYRPSTVEVYSTASNSAGMRIVKFDLMSKWLEYRIAGWSVRAIELAKCKNVTYKINKSLAQGDDCTDIEFSWES